MEYERPYPSVTTACDNDELRFVSTTRAYLLRIPTRPDTWMKVEMLTIPNGWSWKTLGLNRWPARTRHHGPSSLGRINAGPPPAHPRPRLHTAGGATRRGGRARHGVHPRRELRMSFSLNLEWETVTRSPHEDLHFLLHSASLRPIPCSQCWHYGSPLSALAGTCASGNFHMSLQVD